MRIIQPGVGWTLLCLGIGATVMADSFIGVASTRGSMSVDHAAVRGNANVTKGTYIGTNETVSLVELRNGAKLVLGQYSEMAVHEDRAELRSGGVQLHSDGDYALEALGYRFLPASDDTTARVAFEKPERILVAAVSGPIRVQDGHGFLVANLAAGNSYYFEAENDPQSARGAGQQKAAKGKKATNALSRRVRWGIVSGTAGAVGASIGLVSALNGNNASR